MTAAETLYDSFSHYGSGVTLVAVRDADIDRFFIAASVLTSSVNPFTLAVSVGRDRDALPAITTGQTWSLGVLAEHHRPLVHQLTAKTMTPTQRLEALALAGAETSPEGPLWLPDTLVTFWCTTLNTTPVHDQVIVVGTVQRASPSSGGLPLLRWDHGFHTTQDLDAT